MAASFNKVILMGNLTRDPELRYTPQGTAVTDLSMAINSTRGRGNDRKEETTFVDVTVWDRRAETCCQYLRKGRPILVDGRLQQDTWEDRETGQKRSKLRVVAFDVQFLGGRDDAPAGGGAQGGGQRSSRQQSSNTPYGQSDDSSNADFDDDFGGGDDIPF